MQWRVMAVLTFDIEDEARDFYHDVMVAKDKAAPLPQDNANLHKCFHGEAQFKPCEELESWKPS